MMYLELAKAHLSEECCKLLLIKKSAEEVKSHYYQYKNNKTLMFCVKNDE